MKVELSQEEINLIEQALDLWEKEAGQKMFTSMMIDSICRPRTEEEEEKFKEKTNREAEKANQEGIRRKRVSTLLRAKLYQADAMLSEHNV